MKSSRCNVLLVYPRFVALSFWKYVAACEMVGRKYPAPSLGLVTVAAMLPPEWNLRLIDRNTDELSTKDIDDADLVLTTGMYQQHEDIIHVIDLCHGRGKPIAIGGPAVSGMPELYTSADFRIIGEAEAIIDQFVAAWNAGERTGLFEAEKYTVDVTKTPVPCFDLLDFNKYLMVQVQFSRGCPYMCEFCDIIELYGRVPRTKTTPQMLAELDAIYELGYRGHVDFVDDNFIGNKKAVKQFLPSLIAWQKDRGYPFAFSTEASINLAEDDELLRTMRAANFFAVFVGVETPDTDTLVAMQKKQNTRQSLASSVGKISRAGIFVLAGFVLGFDSEKGSVANSMIEAIEQTSIPVCFVNLLYALPNTQLTRRLAREQRLFANSIATDDDGDWSSTGLNFETARPRREILSDALQILERIYDVDAYFERVRRTGRILNMPKIAWENQKQTLLLDLYRLMRAIWLMGIRRREWRKPFWRTLLDCLRHHPEALKSVIQMMAFFVHLGPFSRVVVAQLRAQIAQIDANAWKKPAMAPVTTPQILTSDLPPVRLHRPAVARSR